MKPSTSATAFLYLILALICVTSVGCGPNFGDKIFVKKTEIFYKDGATKADAEKLGKQLEAMGFIDDKRKSVQLVKRDSVWEFRMATTKADQTKTDTGPLKLYCLELSSAFDGDEVEVHLCNQKLETQSIVKGLRGKRYELERTIAKKVLRNDYYYTDVELEQVKNFAAIALGTQLDTSSGFIYHLSQPEKVVEIRMAHPKAAKGDRRLATAARSTAKAASNKIFGGKQVDVLICDQFFQTQNSYSSTNKPTAAP